MNKEKDPKRVAAGRKGGQTTALRLKEDPDFYGRIGKMGGAKGGNMTLQRYGKAFYSEIGRFGGARKKMTTEVEEAEMKEFGSRGEEEAPRH